MLISNRATNVLLVAILVVGIGIVAMLASGARGGPLDPTAAPASTMKSLDEIPGSWSRRLDSTNGSPGTVFLPAGCDSERFKCVLETGLCQFCIPDFPAVLDEETGLVWQRSPSTTSADDWPMAVYSCGAVATGDRTGWRLPTLAELGSVGLSHTSTMPAGNPFTNISGLFWTSTDNIDAPNEAFLIGAPGFGVAIKTGPGRYWCVRGATSNR